MIQRSGHSRNLPDSDRFPRPLRAAFQLTIADHSPEVEHQWRRTGCEVGGRFREDRPQRERPVVGRSRAENRSRTVGLPLDPKMLLIPLIEPLGIPRLEEDTAQSDDSLHAGNFTLAVIGVEWTSMRE